MQFHPSANRLLKVLLRTQAPLITLRDKVPPTRRIRISSTYQQAGTRPSYPEACNKLLYQLQPQGGRHQKQERLQPCCLKRGDHTKSIPKKKKKKKKAKKYDPKEGTRGKTKTEKQLSDLEIINLHEKYFRLMTVKMIHDLVNKLETKIDKLQKTLNTERNRRFKD